MSGTGLTWERACARRLRRHGLAEPLPGTAEAATAVCGMHAQVMPAAEVALGIRTGSTTCRDVHAALWERRELVKTFGPRGTVHVVAAGDLAAWCAALAPLPWTAGRPPSMRMTDEQVDAVVGAVDAALTEADHTVEELDAEVVARTGPWAGDLVVPAFQGWSPRWRQAIPIAAYRGVLCFGPARDRRTVYTSPRRWVPGFTAPEPGGAPERLVLRYLRSYGPATVQQVAQWLGTPVGPARAAVQRLGDAVVGVELDGVRALVPEEDATAGDQEPVRGVRLLPYFDPYVVGCHPRTSLFPGDAVRALTRGQAGTRPVLLVDGTAGGLWHQRRAGSTVHLTVEAFGTLTPRQLEELDAEVRRVAAVLEATPVLALGPVTTRSHL